MTADLTERIIRDLCAECGFELQDYRRSPTYIGMTVTSLRTGTTTVVGKGYPDGVALGDDTLDVLGSCCWRWPHDVSQP